MRLLRGGRQGRPSPQAEAMSISPWSQIPIPDFFDSDENFPNLTFSQKGFRFSSAKISDDLVFCHWPQNLNFPSIFTVSVHCTFPPYFGKIIISTLLSNFPLWFRKIYVFLPTFSVFRFPLVWPWCIYASPNGNACTARPWTCVIHF